MSIRSDLFSAQAAHLWLIHLSDLPAALDQQFLALLNPAEQLQYHSLNVPAVKREYLIARALVRSALSQYADVEPQDWEFVANQFGRPTLSSNYAELRIDFNISHSQGMVACLIACGHQVGLDIENRIRNTPFDDIFHMVLTPHEEAHFPVQSGQESDLHFLHYWTLKEAYSKALGCGLSMDFKDMVCVFEQGAQGDLIEAGFTEVAPLNWQLLHFQIGVSHFLAIAIHKASEQDVVIRLMEGMPGVSEVGDGRILENKSAAPRLFVKENVHTDIHKL